jgi:hypothetical protein
MERGSVLSGRDHAALPRTVRAEANLVSAAGQRDRERNYAHVANDIDTLEPRSHIRHVVANSAVS